MSKKALCVWGGWQGHTPKESCETFVPLLESEGYECIVDDNMSRYENEEEMASFDLIFPIWTMGEMTKEQWQGLNNAVKNGAGIASFHGGIIDSFRTNTDYQWMTGGQWVSHPGGCIPEYTVNISDKEHEITKGLGDFKLTDTEQYYCHIDPGVNILCSTTFTGEHGDSSLYEANTVMP